VLSRYVIKKYRHARPFRKGLIIFTIYGILLSIEVTIEINQSIRISLTIISYYKKESELTTENSMYDIKRNEIILVMILQNKKHYYFLE